MQTEYTGRYITPFGSNLVINMPYPCFDSQKCSPYKVSLLPGHYKIELWGSSGGDTISKETNEFVRGGFGGYVGGILKIEDPLSIFFYVGAKGHPSNTASFNGGGLGPFCHSGDQGQGAGGGGATDVRIIPMIDDESSEGEDEDHSPSLNSRFMVAGAGGGACAYNTGSRGGDNLGLEGEPGLLAIGNVMKWGTPPTGGTQNSPGQCYIRPDGNTNFPWFPGSLGRGGGFEPQYPLGAGAGGSGLYGGGPGGWANSVVSSGAAGSSFVNGCKGCSSFEKLPILTDIKILGGNETMLSPLGVNETGHYGNGFARITVLLGRFNFPESRGRRGRLSSLIHLAAFLVFCCNFI